MKRSIPIALLLLVNVLAAHAEPAAPNSVQQAISAQTQKAQAAQQKAVQDALAKRAVTQPQQIPANFPLPIYDRNVQAVSYYQHGLPQGGSSVTASIQTKDAAAAGYQFYADALKRGAWDIKALPNAQQLQARGIYMLQAKKDRFATIIAFSKGPNDTTLISVSVTQR